MLLLRQDESVPLEVQPQLFGSLSLITWCQVLFYTQYVSCPLFHPFCPCRNRWTLICLACSKFSMRLVVSWGIFVGLILGGSEALLVLTIRVCTVAFSPDYNITLPLTFLPLFNSLPKTMTAYIGPVRCSAFSPRYCLLWGSSQPIGNYGVLKEG